MIGAWRWVEYFDTVEGPDGALYDLAGFAARSDLKRLIRGECVLLESWPDERRLSLSTETERLVRDRGIVRTDDEAVDPVTGRRGRLWALRSAVDRMDRPVLLAWDDS